MSQLPAIDLTQLANDGRHFARKTPLGATEIVDSITGRVVAIIKDPLIIPKLEKRNLPNGEEIWVDETLPAHVLLTSGFGVMAYHPWIIDLICERIAEGVPLTKICKEKGMPTYPILCRWRRMHPYVEDQLAKARQDRAEFLRDKAMLVVEDVVNEEDVAAARLKHEANKWAAGVDDGKFSPKSKVEASLTTPMQILISTGIDRNPPLPETREVGGEIHGQSNSIAEGITAGDDRVGDSGTD